MQIDDADFFVFLAETVNTSDALFDTHGIPRHVVIDERTAKLEIESLSGGIGAKQNVSLATAETAFRFFA